MAGEHDMIQSLDALVKRVDEDRWLASRFAEPATRLRLIALYAAYHEIAKTAEIVSQDTLGAIRLQWWRDAIAALFANETRADLAPLAPLREAIKSADLPQAPFDALIDARENDFVQAPFESWADLERYVDATAGGLIELSIRACDPSITLDEDRLAAIRSAGRAWGFVGLVRALPHWTARNRTFFPKNLLVHVGLDLSGVFASRRGHGHTAAARAVLDRGLGAMTELQRLVRTLPPVCFPAVSYVSFATDYAKSLIRDGGLATDGPAPLGPLARRLKLMQATVRGAL